MARRTIEELKVEAQEFIEDFKHGQGKSKLDPYRKIIERLRNEGLSYAKVAEFLNKQAGLKVSSSTVRMYVKKNLKKDDAIKKTMKKTEHTNLNRRALAKSILDRLKEENEDYNHKKKLHIGDIEKIINTLFDVIKEEVYDGKQVRIRQFGVFKLIEKKSRKGRNIKTGEPINIPRHEVLCLKTSRKLRRYLKEA